MDLSIIIPTLNEAGYIGKTLDTLHQKKSGQLDLEIIVIDAGSSDDTMGMVKGKVDILDQDPALKGAKYKSLNRGGNLANGKVLLFLDADSHVPIDFDLLISEYLNRPNTVGGAFEFEMDGKGVIYRFTEWLNRIRYRLDGKYFGDQAIFCNKSVFEKTKGFPSKPIMEAAYFCRAMRKYGRVGLIKSKVLTSARRFQEGNVYKVLALDAFIWIQFTLGLCVDRYATEYWKENERR
ncbi:MAG: glycosyltransferase family 2 protein [Reichenbachiella sp.]|uniref:TIGR04283 family arsenosugar biosynthesis glycosyltransferase n=1 Tax=Reichenbachiella sp. TaxID=2184521 RepID=UPI0032651084